ncbi:sulfite exporter TauE/SafE family protein [Mucilaginibacter calamicampi]|uniref:Sulfite exporter TauE/SafE family protein n=1 Tax=Mucilaginibacter calamicampi TaxID=1302352 RepID=A0ABW2YWX4_9SPHI
MTDMQVAFFIGLFGSIHCVGMCGPLVLALPVNKGGAVWLIFDKLIYQLGRVISYSILGFVVGLVGKQIWLLGVQQSISIISGILIIAAAMSRLLKLRFFNRPNSVTQTFLNRWLVYALKHRWGHLLIGMLNGFLPCGFVYLALVGAVNTPAPLSAAQYMFWFGIGTLPLMFVAAISSGFITLNIRRRLNNIIPYFMLCLGIWFIMRGLSLNIAYLSPSINADQSICH